MSLEINQPGLFDYSDLDSPTTTYLKQNAIETRSILTRTTEDMIKVGQNLLEAKARLPHGQFIPWVKAELGISQSTAWRFMQVAQGKEIKKKSFTMNDLIEQIAAPQNEDEASSIDERLQATQRAILQRSAQSGIEIGKELAEAAAVLNRSQLLAWARTMFLMDEQDVNDLIANAEQHKDTNLDSLSIDELFTLAGAYSSWVTERYTFPERQATHGVMNHYRELMKSAANMPEFHEKTRFVPAMQPEEYARLVYSIHHYGQALPIKTFKGKIIDGRMRYLACRDAGRLPRLEEWDGDESKILNYIMSVNFKRSNLTEDQIAMALVHAQTMEEPL